MSKTMNGGGRLSFMEGIALFNIIRSSSACLFLFEIYYFWVESELFGILQVHTIL